MTRMSTSGSVFSRDIGSLQVKTRAHPLEEGIILISLCKDPKLANNLFVGCRDKGWQKTCYTSGCKSKNCPMDPFQSKIVAIEIHSTKPIHLRIEEPSAQVKIRTSEINPFDSPV
jgi:hypothetical protein